MKKIKYRATESYPKVKEPFVARIYFGFDKKLTALDGIPDHIPVAALDTWACYDNKKLSQFTHDDFAEFVFDQLDSQNDLSDGNTFIHIYEPARRYIKEAKNIPYMRVYLYGIWDVVKEMINK